MDDLSLFVIAGTIGTLIMAFAIIYFVVSYQRKRFKTDLEIERIKADSERQATLASFRGQENERQRIAKDLHDDIGASLTAIKMSLNFLGDKLSGNNSIYEELLEVRDTLSVSINNVRSISHNLMPYALAHFGLGRAVEQLVNGLSNPPKYEATFVSEGELLELDDETKLMLYRTIQEIINNSIKHSKASRLEVAFNWKENTLHIVVRDNGCGFDYEATLKNSNSGIGLKNLESRLRIIGATNHVESGSNGTTYFIDLALDKNTTEA